MIKKAFIPVAGLGTRLLSATKEQPKEMLPVFAAGKDGVLCVKPLVQQIFEELFDLGIRQFYFIVGKGKRAIEDHFTPDREYLRRLSGQGRDSQRLQLEGFYSRVLTSTIVWVNQPEPKGFGDAVIQARQLVGEDPFLVHAGDTLIKSKAEAVLTRLSKTFAEKQADATLTLQNVEDPRQYGVAEGFETADGIIHVRKVVEKPNRPATNVAIMPIYLFNNTIFEAIESTKPDKHGEIQLTDAIQVLITGGHNVNAIKLGPGDIRLDIGTPESYWEALKLSHRLALSKQH
jgi:UTP--glucose-1-phosphate uridylyltransferase